ncbi:flavin reductase family protein [Aquibacillus sediminis]|uniref:flavin reductase family protein n=1 Tax=Aquibacillus sediminis TaxID=2574734 RepID=UPI001108E429|nr:flavin reductase family protein [Aquibacillus sediminis]
MDSRRFRDAMGKFATGITVVTTDYNKETYGMTVNAFMSVSLDPKLIAVSIDKKATMYTILQKTKQFGVSILSSKQKVHSMLFAKQLEKNQDIAYTHLNGVPVLQDSLVTISCSLYNKVEAGDHMVFFGKVTGIEVNEGDPLLYYGGSYQELND